MTGSDFLPLTVVVPVFNKGGTVSRCIVSIQQQTASPSEIVVVDDASTDNSVEAIRALALGSDIPIHIVANVINRGPGATRNVGISRAAFDWLAFLDADDYWEPTFCEKVWHRIQSDKADFGSSGRITRNLRGERGGVAVILTSPKSAERMDCLFWRTSLQFFPINSSSAIARRSLIARVGGFPEDVRNYEDVTLWARLWLQGRFSFVNEPLSNYERAPGGITNQPRAQRAVGIFLYRILQVAMLSIARGRCGGLWVMVFLLRSLLVWPISVARSQMARALRV